MNLGNWQTQLRKGLLALVGAYIIQDMRFVYCNQRFADIYGYTKGEVCGITDLMDLVHPDDRPFVQDVLRGREAGLISNIQYQMRGIKKDGGVINVEVLGWSTEYRGRPTIIGTVLDITRRRQAEEERSALFSMLTHDIKGPLSLISGYGDLLLESVTSSEHNSMVVEIKKAATRINLLINDMLELSRIESGSAPLDIQPVSLFELIREAVSEIEIPALEMDLSITLDVDDRLPEVEADKAQLARALSNLVANAVNYNRQGGRITIRGGAEDGVSGRVFIEVADTGIGIAEEDLPHVFKRYYRCKKSMYRRGTGLGLAIVKAVVDAHGGEVSVESHEGEGSTFRVVLPVKHTRV